MGRELGTSVTQPMILPFVRNCQISLSFVQHLTENVDLIYFFYFYSCLWWEGVNLEYTTQLWQTVDNLMEYYDV